MRPRRTIVRPALAGGSARSLVAVLAGLGLLGLGAWRYAENDTWPASADTAPLKGAPVRRGPLRMSVLVPGSLKAADSVTLTCEVEGRTTILALTPEGTRVKQGDIVCELDASGLNEERLQQGIEVSNAQAALVKAQQNLQIQVSQNKSDIALARQELAFADQDLRKFLEGERESELERAQQAIDLAAEEAARSAGRLDWSQKLVAKGFLTTSELEADSIAKHRADVELEQAEREQRLLREFQLPRTEAELRAAVEEAQRGVERVELQASARLIDFEAEVRASQARFELEQERLAKIQSQIDRARIRAPKDGMLVYRQFDFDELPLQAGREVRQRQTLMYIPSTEGMIAEAKVHESVLEEIEVGQPCEITVDALRGRRFEGRVSFIAPLPDQNSWWSNPNMRLYRSDVRIQSEDPRLRPGMSCSIEILIEEFEDTLHVPVQSVFHSLEGNRVFVVAGGAIESRLVRIGRFNELWVQILDGLEEGETVLLSPPAGFHAVPLAPPESRTAPGPGTGTEAVATETDPVPTES